MFVKPNRTYDYQELKRVVKVVTKNLNKVIDINYYSVPEVSVIVFLDHAVKFIKGTCFNSYQKCL